MEYLIGAVLAFAAFTLAYAVGALLTGLFLKLTGQLGRYDSATGPAFLLALAAGGYVFYLTALA